MGNGGSDVFGGNPFAAKARFRIDICEHGLAVYGKFPMSAFELIGKLSKETNPSWDFIDPGLAHALGATLVVGSEASLSAWKKEVEAKVKDVADPIQRWLMGPNRGLSSEFLLASITRPAIHVEENYPLLLR